jgi:hypothetical protein
MRTRLQKVKKSAGTDFARVIVMRVGSLNPHRITNREGKNSDVVARGADSGHAASRHRQRGLGSELRRNQRAAVLKFGHATGADMHMAAWPCQRGKPSEAASVGGLITFAPMPELHQPVAVIRRSLAKHPPRVLDPRISSTMLVRDSRTSSANGAFGRHDLHDSDGKKPRVDGAKFATARPQISGVGG